MKGTTNPALLKVLLKILAVLCVLLIIVIVLAVMISNCNPQTDDTLSV